MKNLFIGIDFSKEKFDASLFERGNEHKMLHEEFSNTTDGFKAFLLWVKSNSSVVSSEWLFCGEHTGLYSLLLSEYLVKKHLFMWLENPMQIKKSTGIKRAKTDLIDSAQIALYAWRFEDRARLYAPPGKTMCALRVLFAYREQLIQAKVAILVSARETQRVMKDEHAVHFMYEHAMKIVAEIEKDICDTEKEMEQEIRQDEEVKQNYDLVTSVKGIGMVNAIAFIVTTENFTRFESARQYACYCGVVPFEKSSGTSIKGGKHISRIANIRVKTFLTQAARSAVLYDKQLKEYYDKKLKEGKKDQVIINNVRNKLLQRVFAVIKNRKPFEENYRNYLSSCA